MSATNAARSPKPDPLNTKARSGLGLGLFVASAIVLVAGLSALQFEIASPLVWSLAVSIGGWLLVFSALAFYLVDPRAGASDSRYGASVGAVTMALLVTGWTTIGHTTASIVSGALVGAVFGVLIGRAARSLRSALVGKTKPEAVTDSAGVRDPWIDP